MLPLKSMRITRKGVAMVWACWPSGAAAATAENTPSKKQKSNNVHPNTIGKNLKESPEKANMTRILHVAPIKESGTVTHNEVKMWAVSVYRRSEVSCFMNPRSSISNGMSGKLWRLSMVRRMNTKEICGRPNAVEPMPLKILPSTKPMPMGMKSCMPTAPGFRRVVMTFRPRRVRTCWWKGAAYGPRRTRRVARPSAAAACPCTSRSISSVLAPLATRASSTAASRDGLCRAANASTNAEDASCSVPGVNRSRKKSVAFACASTAWPHAAMYARASAIGPQ
mmetsp:Transcript_94222/g.288271  ORF Transcript_94222/g.288271 Transcript_94222/m.288271 type:complete len:281 (+) Transcript_94222:452-1294(+)